jgi:hypothetical protein
MESPADKVAAAMPGTIAEIAERVGYPVGTVLHQITTLRREGRRVNAIRGEPIMGDVGVRYGPTTFALDKASREE